MIDRLNRVEQGLRIWRCIVLVLTIVMLVVSIIESNQMSIIVLIICFFALILFQLKTLPITSYQLFILLQVAYFIYLFGKLLQDFYSSPSTAFASATRNLFYMATLVLFMTILWRHYQKDLCKCTNKLVMGQMNIEDLNDDGEVEQNV